VCCVSIINHNIITFTFINTIASLTLVHKLHKLNTYQKQINVGSLIGGIAVPIVRTVSYRIQK
jgi:hypothetical protein